MENNAKEVELQELQSRNASENLKVCQLELENANLKAELVSCKVVQLRANDFSVEVKKRVIECRC